MTFALVALILLDAALAVMLLVRTDVLSSMAGRLLAFVGLVVLPAMVTALGFSHHLQRSTTTSFCLSCHVMEPYGQSMLIDSVDHLPANHFQNRRIDQEHACYTCHTNYAMFGDVRAKLNGLVHLWVNYVGPIPEPLTLYEPYQNRECLHCHAGARSYEESDMHVDVLAELQSNDVSCLECHDLSHDVGSLDELPVWREGESGP